MSWIEKYIISQLLTHELVRVKDLAPEGVEQNLLSHYLKKLISGGYVEKVDRGMYTLSVKGQGLAGTFSIDTGKQSENIKTCIMFYSKNKNGEYLLYKWQRQPYMGEVTLIHDRMKRGDRLNDALSNALDDKIGKQIPVMYLMQGFVKIFHSDELVSHMNVLVYELDAELIDMPFEAKNGTAFFCDTKKAQCMDGVQDLLDTIEEKKQGFEITLQY